MKILIVEDDLLVARNIKDKLEKLQYHVTGIADSYEQALSAIETENPDLALLDIELKGSLSGIDLAEKLTAIGIPFIYLTSNQDFQTYTQAKNTQPLKNLAKPIDLLNLRNALWEIDLSKKVPVEAIIHLISDGNGNKLRINPNDILYIKADGSYSQIYFIKEGKFTLTMNLKTLLQKADWPNIVRVLRSFAVNIQHVKSIIGNQIKMADDEIIDIAPTYKEKFLRHLKTV